MTKNSDKDKILTCTDVKIFHSCDMIFYSAYEGTQKNVWPVQGKVKGAHIYVE